MQDRGINRSQLADRSGGLMLVDGGLIRQRLRSTGSAGEFEADTQGQEVSSVLMNAEVEVGILDAAACEDGAGATGLDCGADSSRTIDQND